MTTVEQRATSSRRMNDRDSEQRKKRARIINERLILTSSHDEVRLNKVEKIVVEKKRRVADIVIVAGLSLGVKRKTARERKEGRR